MFFRNLALALVSATVAVQASSSSPLALEETVLSRDISNPSGAFATSFNLSGGSVPAWQSKYPTDESTAEQVVIVTHGVARDYGDYFNYLTTAWKAGKKQGLPYATSKTLRIAPLFAIDSDDTSQFAEDTLKWTDDNGWCIGSGSVSPAGSDMSSLTVYDELVTRFSNKEAYPNMQQITFLGHGCGGIIAQRYAAVGEVPSNGVAVRFIVGNPSSMVYWTKDRPETVNKKTCSYYNGWYYGLDDFFIPYSPWDGVASTGFKRYASRDVRYLVATSDTSANGDQGCEAKALGGTARYKRSLAYFKYLHLLSGDKTSASSYPGNFKSTVSNRASFQGVKVVHTMNEISNVGHDAGSVIASSNAVKAIFGN